LEAVYQQFKEKGLIVAGFDISDDREVVLKALASAKVTFPNILDLSEAARKVAMTVYQKPGRSAVPLSYLIDREGVIIDAWYGFDEGFPQVVKAMEASSSRKTRQTIVGRLYPLVCDYLAISPDLRHFAYGRRPDGFMRDSLVYDGKVRETYDSLTSRWLLFSPDSRSYAYSARRGAREYAVRGGKEQKGYDGVDKISFSPDGRHLAFIAAERGKKRVVIDGNEGAPYDEVSLPLFSADGRRALYIAREKGKMRIVDNGRELKRYDDVKSPVRSPDGATLMYAATMGGR
jgi:hypothetical protein